MQLYFLRHAESNGNTNGQYDHSLAGVLSANGWVQTEAIVQPLLAYAFDHIIVSPLERAIYTILPYLKQTGRSAEAWCELAEALARDDGRGPADPVRRYGPEAILPAPVRAHIRLREDKEGRLLPPPDESYAEGQRRARLAGERLLTLYGGQELAVLMVGHACNGARVLEGLMRIDMDGRFQHANTGLTLIEQKQNGDFVMRFQNRVET